MQPEAPRPLHYLDLADPAHRGFAAMFLAKPFDEAFARWYVHLTSTDRPRGPGYAAIFRRLARHDRPLIVETGSMRMPGVVDFATDGASTFLFHHYCRDHGGECWTVDIDPAATRHVAALCDPRIVRAATGDSVAFLRAFARKDAIRLLYLDSLDLDADDPLPSQRHHLHEVEAVYDALAPGAIIAVDDHFVHRGAPVGKGTLVERFLRERHVPLVYDGYLKVWQLGEAAPDR